MEFMTVKGSMKLLQEYDALHLAGITEDLAAFTFIDEEGVLFYKVEKGRFWILGEGLIDREDGDRFIAIVKRLYRIADAGPVVNVNRMLWELNIALSNLDTSVLQQRA